jgi:hypothetical protein
MDALDSDPDLDEREKLRARLAVQGMYNASAESLAAGGGGGEEAPQFDPHLRGATTTGQGSKEAAYELRPRPKRRGEQ